MKKKYLIFSLLCLLSMSIFTAEVERITLKDAQGYDREYYKYVPDHYDGTDPYGIFLILHAFGQSGADMFNMLKMDSVMSEFKFILIAPSALPEQDENVINDMADIPMPMNAMWGANMGFRMKVFDVKIGETVIPEWELKNLVFNQGVDDSAFLSQIVNDIKENYNISSKNHFVFGVSMGGYMGYQYTLKNSSKIAGLISFGGSMSGKMQNIGSGRVNLCDFHSLDDEVIAYEGSVKRTVAPQEEGGDSVKIELFWGYHKDEVINYWVGKGKAKTPPVVTEYPDSSETGYTAKKFHYERGTGATGREVIHYQMTGAGHAQFLSKNKGDCIDYVDEFKSFIWNNTTLTKAGETGVQSLKHPTVNVYPNPAEDYIVISGMDTTPVQVNVYTTSGQEIQQVMNSERIDVSSLLPGAYLVKIQTANGQFVSKFIKQ